MKAAKIESKLKSGVKKGEPQSKIDPPDHNSEAQLTPKKRCREELEFDRDRRELRDPCQTPERVLHPHKTESEPIEEEKKYF
jgi:hypothetical protein